MGQEKRFGKRIAGPSSVRLVHEPKLMAPRQSPDAPMAAEARPADGLSPRDAVVAPFPSDAF